MLGRIFCLAGLLAGGAPVCAETVASFQLSATVARGCLVASDAGGRWGRIDLGTVAAVGGSSAQGALVSSAGAGLSIECTPGVASTLSADAGDHPAGNGRQMMLTGGTALIPYVLFANGDTTPWIAPLPLPTAGGARLVPVRAVATPAVPAMAGTYTDTVRVTLSW